MAQLDIGFQNWLNLLNIFYQLLFIVSIICIIIGILGILLNAGNLGFKILLAGGSVFIFCVFIFPIIFNYLNIPIYLPNIDWQQISLPNL